MIQIYFNKKVKKSCRLNQTWYIFILIFIWSYYLNFNIYTYGDVSFLIILDLDLNFKVNLVINRHRSIYYKLFLFFAQIKNHLCDWRCKFGFFNRRGMNINCDVHEKRHEVILYSSWIVRLHLNGTSQYTPLSCELRKICLFEVHGTLSEVQCLKDWAPSE